MPSGLLARGAFALARRRRPARGLLLGRVPRPGRGDRRRRAAARRVAITATPGSTLAARAGARALVSVLEPARRHPHAGVLRQRRRGARRLGRGHGRRRRSTTRSGGCPRSSRRRSPRRAPGSTSWGRSTPANAIAFGSGAGVGGRARGGAAAEGGRGDPDGGRRDTRGRDVGDDGAPARRPRAQPADAARRPAPRRGGGNLRRAGGDACSGRRSPRDRRLAGSPRSRLSPAAAVLSAGSGSTAASTSTGPPGRTPTTASREAPHEPRARRDRLRQRLRGPVSRR